MDSFYRKRKVGDHHILTTDDGSHVMLDTKDYIRFRSGNVDEDLQCRLEQAGIMNPDPEKLQNSLQKRYSHLSQGPSLHIIVMTEKCNLKCSYCQANSGKNGKDLDKKTASKIVNFIWKSPSKNLSIEFQGGEPLLNFSTVQHIVREVKKKPTSRNVKFSIVTNMEAMDDSKLKYLKDNNIGICTSLDGPKRLHDKHRKTSHQNTVDWIAKIRKEVGPNRLNALLTVTKDSLPLYKEIIDEYIKRGLGSIWLRFISRLGCADSDWEKLGYEPERFVQYFSSSIDYIVENDLPIREKFTSIILKKIFDEYDPNFLDLRSPCGAAIGQLAYGPDGSVYSCDEGRMVGDIFKLGDVSQKYSEVLGSDEVCNLVAASVNDVFMCDTCAYKPYCGLCPVCSYSEHGSVITDIVKDRRCKMLMGIFDYIFDRLATSKKHRRVFEKWSSIPLR